MRAAIVAASLFLAAVARGAGISTKAGVEWRSASGAPVSPILVAGLYRAKWACESNGLGPFVVTSLYDSTQHLPNSFHYKGLAADLRTNHLAPDSIQRMYHTVADALGPGWDVILEVDHIHVEYDPREANENAAFLGVR